MVRMLRPPRAFSEAACRPLGVALFALVLSCAARDPPRLAVAPLRAGGTVVFDAGAAPAATPPVRAPCDAGLAARDAELIRAADAQRDLALEQWKDTKGVQGLAPPRDGPGWDKDAHRTIVEDIPGPIRQSIAAREQFLRDVPPECDTASRGLDYAFYAGDRYFAHGHFEEARRLLRPLYEQHCTTSELGHVTWRDLIVMSNMEEDNAQSRRLAEAEKRHPCAGPLPEVHLVDRGAGEVILINAAFDDAAKVLVMAENAPAGSERERLQRKAASMYHNALDAAPAHKDAPLAAMRAASLDLQLGEVYRAINLYFLFISHYGTENVLDRLEHGGIDPEASPKIVQPPQPAEYKTRIELLAEAYDALASAFMKYFAYGRVAESFALIARNPRFDTARRGHAARIAMELYSGLGDGVKVAEMHAVATSPAVRPDEGERVHVDYLLAAFAFRQWSAAGPKTADEPTRKKAVAALTRFHDGHRGRPEAARYVVEAAYRIATMQHAAGDTTYREWFKTTLTDLRYFDEHPPGPAANGTPSSRSTARDSPFADYREDAELALQTNEEKMAASSSGLPTGITGGLAPLMLPAPMPEP
jgi:hypothetical protein